MAAPLEGDLNKDGKVNFIDEELAAVAAAKELMLARKAEAAASQEATSPDFAISDLQRRRLDREADVTVRRDSEPRTVVAPTPSDSVLGFELGDVNAPTTAFERRMQEALGENIQRRANQSTDSLN